MKSKHFFGAMPLILTHWPAFANAPTATFQAIPAFLNAYQAIFFAQATLQDLFPILCGLSIAFYSFLLFKRYSFTHIITRLSASSKPKRLAFYLLGTLTLVLFIFLPKNLALPIFQLLYNFLTWAFFHFFLGFLACVAYRMQRPWDD